MGVFKGAATPSRRSGHAASVRGRISGPISQDDEFPIRNPGTGIAFAGEPRQIQPPSEHTSSMDPEDAHPEASQEGHAKPAAAAPSGSSHDSQPPPPPIPRPRNPNANRASTVRFSAVSNDVNPPQRKKSTIKSAIGKLFGRKKRNLSETAISEHHASTNSIHPRESPTREPAPDPAEEERKRTTSFPVSDFDKALRSHSIGPDDIIAIESARNSMQIEPGPRSKRPATSSKIFCYPIRDPSSEMRGLTPRPASSHAQGSRTFDGGHEDQDEVGRAVSIGNPAYRRKSRSLSQLPTLSNSQVDVRRRSDEIRHLRQSREIALLQPKGSDTLDDYTPTPTEGPRDESVAESRPSSPPPFEVDEEEAGEETEAEAESEAILEVGEAKIPADRSAEERMLSLEARNEKLERLVTQLLQAMPRANHQAPPSHPANEGVSVGTVPTPSLSATLAQDQASSRRCEGVAQDLHHAGAAFALTRPGPRPLSAVTIRGTTSMPTLPSEVGGSLSADHYITLKALLDTEIAARQALESQVIKLTHRINRISRTAHPLDTAVGPRAGFYSTFEHDEEDEEEELHTAEDHSESEAFRTPHEERFESANSEDFWEEEDTVQMKRAPRTLSLGQMTLGNSARPEARLDVDL